MAKSIPEDKIGTEYEDEGVDKDVYPWKVTSYRCWEGYPLLRTYVVEGHYRWYWQANLVSWWVHHFWGRACNTWKKKTKEEIENEKTQTIKDSNTNGGGLQESGSEGGTTRTEHRP